MGMSDEKEYAILLLEGRCRELEEAREATLQENSRLKDVKDALQKRLDARADLLPIEHLQAENERLKKDIQCVNDMYCALKDKSASTIKHLLEFVKEVPIDDYAHRHIYGWRESVLKLGIATLE